MLETRLRSGLRFSDREHRGVPSSVLVTIQNNIVAVCSRSRRLGRRDPALPSRPCQSGHRGQGRPRRSGVCPHSHSASGGSEVIDSHLLLTTKRDLATALRVSGPPSLPT